MFSGAALTFESPREVLALSANGLLGDAESGFVSSKKFRMFCFAFSLSWWLESCPGAGANLLTSSFKYSESSGLFFDKQKKTANKTYRLGFRLKELEVKLTGTLDGLVRQLVDEKIFPEIA